MSLRVAVVGAGIGKFHAREYAKRGCIVAAIVARTIASAREATEELEEKYGIHANAYASVDELHSCEKLDAISICTPPNLHFVEVRQCLSAGVSVLCEKPFVLEKDQASEPLVRELCSLAREKKLIVAENTQLVALLHYVSLPDTLKEFAWFSQPRDHGRGMLDDHASHANSLLVRLVPKGRAESVHFSHVSEERIVLDFTYASEQHECKVTYEFLVKEERPRELRFSINGEQFHREIGEGYAQRLVGTSAISIEDPFSTSIGRFVDAIGGRGEPLVSQQEMIENAALYDALIAAFDSETQKSGVR